MFIMIEYLSRPAITNKMLMTQGIVNNFINIDTRRLDPANPSQEGGGETECK
jgi:hypothetical protein